MKTTTLQKTTYESKLGTLIILADDKSLYLLEFANRSGDLIKKINTIATLWQADITAGENAITQQIKYELNCYFDGKSNKFETPVILTGSDFQKNVWSALKKIPMGETRSYGDIAKSIHKHTAFRAVANANAANSLAIIVPCHRVIQSGGLTGGYAGGVMRKQWLLDHEKALT